MTIQFVHDYELVNCGADGCDQTFAMHSRFYAQTKRTGETWYCPKGHPRVWSGQTTEQQLREARAQLVASKDQLEAAVREAEALRVRMLRDRQRFAAGVCPCCNRSFTNVRRHMETKHPDYDATHVTGTISYKCGCGRSFATMHGLRIHQGKARDMGWAEPGVSRWRSHLTVVAS